MVSSYYKMLQQDMLLLSTYKQSLSSEAIQKLIRPPLDYASIVWNPHLKGEIESLENVQKFALQVCLKSWDSEYNALLRVANLPPLHKRQAQLSLCHLYKIIRNQCYFPPIFSARETRTHVNRSFYSPNFSHGLTLISIPLYPMWSHCGIAYLNLLYVLPHSLFLNCLSIGSFCNFIS